MKQISLVCILQALFLATCLSQVAGGKKFLISLYAFEYAEDLKTVTLLDTKGRPEQVRLSTANIISNIETRKSDDSFVTIHENELVEKGDETFYPIAAKVKIPLGINNPLIVLFPSNGEEKYRSVVLDGNINNFPPGSYTLLNVSGSSIRGMIGKSKIGAKPGQTTSFNPPGGPGEPMRVLFQHNSGKGWKTFGSTKWYKDAEQRFLLCAFSDQKSNRLKIRALPLSVPRPEKEPNIQQ